MRKLNKITATLSIATSVLLQACSDGADTTSAIPAEANTKAPALIASWSSGCVVTSSGTNTTTGSSGGGSVSGGAGFITNAIFNADGNAELSTQNFASSACNPNTSTGFNQFDTRYFIGAAGIANDGSAATNVRFISTTTTYTIFQISNNSSLYLGDFATSTAGNDGSSENKRLDGLGVELKKI